MSDAEEPLSSLVSVVFDALSAELTPIELDPAQIVAGEPRLAFTMLDASGDGRIERGIWEHTPGVTKDVEDDELFVVVSGRATVEIEGGPILELGPGTVGILRAGARTTWTVHETLRKVFQTTAE